MCVYHTYFIIYQCANVLTFIIFFLISTVHVNINFVILMTITNYTIIMTTFANIRDEGINGKGRLHSLDDAARSIPEN